MFTSPNFYFHTLFSPPVFLIIIFSTLVPGTFLGPCGRSCYRSMSWSVTIRSDRFNVPALPPSLFTLPCKSEQLFSLHPPKQFTFPHVITGRVNYCYFYVPPPIPLYLMEHKMYMCRKWGEINVC